MACPFFLARLIARSGLARFLPAVRRWTDGGGAFVHYYSDRVLAAPYRELRDGGALLDGRVADAIDLSAGEPRFDIVPSISSKLPADRRGTPPLWGLVELREAVAALLHAEHDLPVDPTSELLVTQGVAGAFNLAVDTFLNRGDRVILFAPASPLFSYVLRQRRARIRWLSTWMDKGWTRFHLQHLVKHLRFARMIVVNSPANPTGGVLAPEDLEQIAWWANRHDVLIFSDEAFTRFHHDHKPLSIATLPRATSRTLTAGSVSKGHALASARTGWLAGHRHLLRPCALTATIQCAHVPTVCQQIALTALQQGAAAFAPIRANFAARRHYTFERLEGMGLKPAWPAGAFFFWVPVQELGTAGRVFAERLLAEKNVLLSPGEPYAPGGSGHVRLSYAGDEGRLRQGLARLAEFVRDLPKTGKDARRAA